VDWGALNEVILGCANQAGEDCRNVARMSALIAGLPVEVPASTVNRLCASGLDAVAVAARSVRLGDCDLVIAGGVESMSRAPYVMGKPTVRFSRDIQVYDTTIGWRFINSAFNRQFGTESMGETAENVADRYSVSRADQDKFALRSQLRAQAAQRLGFFSRELVSVSDISDGYLIVDDEHPRPDTKLEVLAELKPLFRKPGTVTAGNSSGISDGAAALLIASEAAAHKYGLEPRAEIIKFTTAGVPPRLMGIGPVPAVQKLLSETGLTMADIDLIELNEAFAAQVVACTRLLALADDAPHINPHGGAIALGHPLGMTGARLVMTALNGLETLGLKRAIATMCVGVGQGAALLIERR
jgi:3-oxoadipyl-CoA thiolase